MVNLEALIRNIPDFPKPGIQFKDITPLLKDGPSFKYAIDQLAARVSGWEATVIVGPEARGFVVGSALAYRLGLGIIPIRKPGKLPYTTVQHTYDLEYGQDTLQIHSDALGPGDRVLVVDDLLATGGTVAATIALVNKLGAEVIGAAFIIELDFLAGRKKLGDIKAEALIKY